MSKYFYNLFNLLIVLSLIGCAPSQSWRNPGLEASGVDSNHIESRYNYDRNNCVQTANNQFGSTPPNDLLIAQQKCSKLPVASAYACGYEASSANTQWSNNRNNAINLCLNSKGWYLYSTTEKPRKPPKQYKDWSEVPSNASGCLQHLDGTVSC